MTCCTRTSCASWCCSWRSRRLTNFHPWWKSILQKYASCTTILAFWHLCSIYSWMRPLNSTSWRHWVMMTRWVSVRSLWTITTCKMMAGNSFSVWMLLSSCSSWIKEIIYTLKSTTTLPRNFTVFVNRVLKLNIWKSGKHLISPTGALSHLSRSSRSTHIAIWS